MASTFLIICLAVSAESIDGWLTESRDKITSLGDRVELDCIRNSSHPVTWRFMRQGSRENEGLAFNSHLRPNISDSYSIVSKDFGQVTLVIDHVLATLAGRYECLDLNDGYKLLVQVIVLDPTPTCNESAMFPWKNILCSFRYVGNLAPELEWMPLGNTSWSASCNASNGTVDCTFENFCTGNNPLPNAIRLIHNTPPLLEICSGDKSTCEWGNVSSSVGILQIKGCNRSIGGWQCNTIGSTTTSAFETIILVPISVGVIIAVVLLLLIFFLLHKKYGICRMKRKALDVPFEATTDEPVCSQVHQKISDEPDLYSQVHEKISDESDLYSQVHEKKKEDPIQTQTGFIVEGIDKEELYGRVNKGKKEDPIQTQTGFIVEGIDKEELYTRVNRGKKEDPIQTQTGFIVEEIDKEELYTRVNRGSKLSIISCKIVYHFDAKNLSLKCIASICER